MPTVVSHIVTFARLLKAAFTELGKNDPLRMAGATAFFTTFALPPILIIITQALGLFFDPKVVQGQLFKNLKNVIGAQSVEQVITVLKAFSSMAQNWFVTIGGFLFLVFVATTLLKVVRSSVNQVWKIKAVTKKQGLRGLGNRARAVAVILLMALLFLIGLVIEAAQALLGQYLYELMPRLAPYFNTGLNHVLSLLFVTAWFALLFRFLPDAVAQWRVVFAGAFLTAVLFTFGKIIIRWLLTYSNINTVYGASGSIILLLLFVFYSSLILYFGAAFTKIWSVHYHKPIIPKRHAMHYKLAETALD